LDIVISIVAFFGGLDIIASTVLTISNLASSFEGKQGDDRSLMIAGDYANKQITQGNQGSVGDNNRNTWNEKKETTIIRGDVTFQGDQSVSGNNNVNTWNNSDTAPERYERHWR
jgi:hypothetical protein